MLRRLPDKIDSLRFSDQPPQPPSNCLSNVSRQGKSDMDTLQLFLAMSSNTHAHLSPIFIGSFLRQDSPAVSTNMLCCWHGSGREPVQTLDIRTAGHTTEDSRETILRETSQLTHQPLISAKSVSEHVPSVVPVVGPIQVVIVRRTANINNGCNGWVLSFSPAVLPAFLPSFYPTLVDF